MPMGLTLMCNNTQSSCCAHRRVRISAFWWKWNLWRQEEGICFIPRGGLDERFRDSPSTFHFCLKSIGLEVDADGRSAETLYCTCTLPHNVQINYIDFQKISKQNTQWPWNYGEKIASWMKQNLLLQSRVFISCNSMSWMYYSSHTTAILLFI